MSIAKFQKVVSLFKTTLADRLTDSATDVTLTAVPGGVMQYPAWMTVEPLSENVEIIYLPAAPTSTSYASVVRGIDPEADDDTAVVAFKKPHPAGVDVIIAPVHRNWNELVKVMDGTDGTGGNTLRIGDETAADVTIYAQNDQATKPFVRYDESDSKWLISNDGVSTYDIASGGSGLTRGLGVDIQTSAITLDVRSSGGLRNNQGTGSQQCDVDPAIVARLDTANTWGAAQSLTAARLLITTDPATANEGVRKRYVDAGDLAGKFGDGSDGALAITSGTTTLNESTRDYYQYTSLSITGTGALAIGSNHQNKPVYIYVQGDLTVTSSATPAVDGDGRGGAGGTAGTGPAGSGGGGGSSPVFFGVSAFNIGSSGGGGVTSVSGSPRSGSGGGGGGSLTSDATAGVAGSTGGTAGPAGIRTFYSANASTQRHVIGYVGAGGGGGSASYHTAGTAGVSGGAGGGGGAGIIFIVGGNINITSAFYARGAAGTVGGTGTEGAGGGGGGGGGFIGILYAGTVTANTATFTVTGGTGGGGGGGGSGGGAGGNGANGASLVRKIIASQL